MKTKTFGKKKRAFAGRPKRTEKGNGNEAASDAFDAPESPDTNEASDTHEPSDGLHGTMVYDKVLDRNPGWRRHLCSKLQ